MMNVNEGHGTPSCFCQFCVPDMQVLDGFIPAARSADCAPVVEAVVAVERRPEMPRKPFMPIPALLPVAAN